MNVLYLYPDLLNLHGDRGNILALKKIASLMEIKLNWDRINNLDEKIDFDKYDLILISPGELFVIEKIIESLKPYKKDILNYLNSGKYLYCIGTSASIFAKTIIRKDKVFEGLDIGNFDVIEKDNIFGNDIIFDCEGQKNCGSQIQVIDILRKENNYLGKVIYGYGNNNDGFEGIKFKNLIITNTLGPLFIKNPWLVEKTILNLYPNLKYKPIDYSLEEESLKNILEFNLGKDDKDV